MATIAIFLLVFLVFSHPQHTFAVLCLVLTSLYRKWSKLSCLSLWETSDRKMDCRDMSSVKDDRVDDAAFFSAMTEAVRAIPKLFRKCDRRSRLVSTCHAYPCCRGCWNLPLMDSLMKSSMPSSCRKVPSTSVRSKVSTYSAELVVSKIGNVYTCF